MNTPSALAFERYRVDVATRQLLRDGVPVSIRGKAFDLLVIFCTSNGAVLSREQIYERLWPAGCVEDGNLSQNVYLLRRALDPDGDGRAYIETTPRYGYRFLKCVRETRASAAPLAHRMIAAVLACAVCLFTLLHPHADPLPASAQQLYALGQFHLGMRSRSDLAYARDYFAQIVRHVPRRALGYSGLAASEALLAEFEPDGSPAQRQDVESADRSRDEALSRDPHDAQALAVSGFIAYRFSNDANEAERYLERALASDGRNAEAHHWHGVLLLAQGRLAASIGEFETAHRLQPTSEVYSRWLARAYTYARRPNDATVLAVQTLRINSGDAPAWLTLACAQEQRGELRQALRTLKHLERLVPSERRYVIPDEARLEALLDPRYRRALRASVDRLLASNGVDPFEAALFYRTIGQEARAQAILRSEKHTQLTSAIERFDPRTEG